jgi:hypothetical protein
MRGYRQALLRRVLDLAQSVITTWNAGFPVGAIVCARSLLETIATFHSFLKRAEVAAVAKDWATIGRLVDAYAFSTSSGPKQKASEDDPPRIGAVVKSFLQSTQPGSEEFWNQICDTAHPNGRRMLEYAGALTDQTYTAKSPGADEPDLFIAVFNALHSCCWLMAADDDFEILLAVIRNCGDLEDHHPLLVDRRQREELTASLTKELGPMKAGPAKKKE